MPAVPSRSLPHLLQRRTRDHGALPVELEDRAGAAGRRVVPLLPRAPRGGGPAPRRLRHPCRSRGARRDARRLRPDLPGRELDHGHHGRPAPGRPGTLLAFPDHGRAAETFAPAPRGERGIAGGARAVAGRRGHVPPLPATVSVSVAGHPPLRHARGLREGPLGVRPLLPGGRGGLRRAHVRPRGDGEQPDPRAAAPLHRGAQRQDGLPPPRAAVLEVQPLLLGRRDLPPAVDEPAPGCREGTGRTCLAHLERRARAGRRLDRHLLRGHPPEAGRGVHRAEPSAVGERLRGRDALGDAGRGHARQAVPARGRRPRLQPRLRRPRRRVRPRLALVRYDRLDPARRIGGRPAVTSALSRFGHALGRLFAGPDAAEMRVGPGGPVGDLAVPRGGDGVWEVQTVQGRPTLSPDASSYYLYFVLPEELRTRATNGLWVDVEYFGDRFAQFRVQYASRDRAAEFGGVYKTAEQRWDGQLAGLGRFRRAVFPLPDFDPEARQNHGASFRIEFRRDVKVARVTATLAA